MFYYDNERAVVTGSFDDSFIDDLRETYPDYFNNIIKNDDMTNSPKLCFESKKGFITFIDELKSMMKILLKKVIMITMVS